MEGSYFVEKREIYSDVEAYSVATVYAAGDSSTEGGGYMESNIRIDWTTEGYSVESHTGGGITGQGWYTGDERSPFYNFTDEQLDQVVNYANANGNLNNYFENWGNRTDIDGALRGEFATEAIQLGCGAVVGMD